MAVYTYINNQELTKHLNNYKIGKLKKFNEIKEGVENSNFKIETENKIYILTIYEKRVAQDDLPYFIDLMIHLSEKEFFSPNPIKSKSGKYIEKFKNKNSALISFLYGKQIISPKNSHCFELGKSLSQMHMATQDFKKFRQNSLGQESWKILFENCVRKKNLFLKKNEINLIYKTLSLLENHWPKHLPVGQIHGDLFKDNVFFHKNKVSGIIDFYFSCTDFLSYDLAVCINDWCFNKEGEYLEKNTQSLIEGYEKIRRLDKNEIKSIPILTLGASVRFFLTRLYDWINTPQNANVNKKNPMEYFYKIKLNLNKL